MKLSIVTILIFGFVGTAVFSVVLMGHGSGNHENGICVASEIRGTSCPESALASLVFHAGTFKSFSTAIISGGYLAALFIVVVFLSLAPHIIAGTGTISALRIMRANLFRLIYLPPKNEFTYWFSLHENSPAAQ